MKKSKLKINLAVCAALSLYMTASGDVITEFSSTTTGFTTIALVSATDLANGIVTERDFTDGNWDAAATTDGIFSEVDYVNNPGNTSASVRYKLDLGSLTYITTVNSYAKGRKNAWERAKQNYSLYGSTVDTTSWDETNTEVWTLIGTVDTTGETPIVYSASSITGIDASYRELMWVDRPVNLSNEHTVWKEFDVIPEPATLGMVASAGLLLLLWRRRLR